MIVQSGMRILNWGRKRIPPFAEILSLFSAIVFLIYGWTIFAFFWKLPSWLLILTPSEISILIAYLLTTDLFESLIMLMIFLAVCIILPSGWLRDDLAVTGSVLMFTFAFWACLFALNSLIGLPTLSETLLLLLGLLASTGAATLLVKKNSILRRFTQGINERLTIFLYIWIPLSLFALVVLIVRSVGRLFGVS